MRKALRKVFEKRQYKGIAVLMFTLSYALFAIIPSIPTIKVLFSLEGFSFTRKLKFLFTSVASFTTVHPLYSVLLSVLLALLFSLTFTVSIFLYRKNYASKRSALSGILGGIGSAFGAGCFACGNLALGFLFTGVGSASLFGR